MPHLHNAQMLTLQEPLNVVMMCTHQISLLYNPAEYHQVEKQAGHLPAPIKIRAKRRKPKFCETPVKIAPSIHIPRPMPAGRQTFRAAACNLSNTSVRLGGGVHFVFYKPHRNLRAIPIRRKELM